jgi:hypothetical protein
MNELPGRDEFFKHLNTKFRALTETGETAAEFELTEVSEIRKRRVFQAFSMVFETRKTIAPEQMSYLLEHDVLGTLIIFLAPFEETADGYRFEALFNQKINDAGD